MNFEIKKSKKNFKQRLCLFLAVVLAFACLQPSYSTLAANLNEAIYAQVTGGNVTAGNVTWGNASWGNVTPSNVENFKFELNEDGKSYTVHSTTKEMSTCSIPSEYNGLPVTKIGEYAFYGTNVKYVVIPGTVTEIGVSAFAECEYLAGIMIPSSVEKIGSNAFYGSSDPGYRYPYSDLYVYAQDLAAWCNIDFGNSYANPFDIWSTKFYSNGKFQKNIVIPHGVKQVKPYAFYGYEYISSVTFPSTVEIIGESAFGSSYVGSVSFSEGLKVIEDEAFVYCRYLKSINIPDGVTSIGYEAFESCENLSEITLPKTLTNIDAYAFCGTNYYNDGKNWDKGILYINDHLIAAKDNSSMDYEIKDGTLTIADSAFRNLSINSLTIPSSVTNIGTDAFAGGTIRQLNIEDIAAWCNINFEDATSNPMYRTEQIFINGVATKDVVIPVEVKNISAYAFYGCDLSSVEISSGVTGIGDYAFYNCLIDDLVIPSSVINVGESFIEYYRNDGGSWVAYIVDIYYEGTKEQWSALSSKLSSNPYYNNLHFNTDIENWREHYGDGVVTDPTCENYGYITYTCSCGYKKVVKTEPALGHTYPDEWSIKEVTCTTDGYKYKICSTCGYQTTRDWVYSTGHKYVYLGQAADHSHLAIKECSACGEKREELSIVSGCVKCNFNVTKTSSGYKLISYTEKESNINIPATCDGVAVTAIGNSCFKGSYYIRSVNIESGVKSIGALAFMNCAYLQRVIIPASVTSIGAQAFYGFSGVIFCPKNSTAHKYAVANNLKFVLTDDMPIVHTENTEIDFDKFVIRTAVQNAEDITEILGIGEGATVIATASFAYGDIEILGTGTVVSVFVGNDFIGDFTLVVEGDTNGDGACDALDVQDVVFAANGFSSLSGAYAMAADCDMSDSVGASDYQAIVNKAIS